MTGGRGGWLVVLEQPSFKQSKKKKKLFLNVAVLKSLYLTYRLMVETFDISSLDYLIHQNSQFEITLHKEKKIKSC